MLTINKVKQFLRADGNEEDELIEVFIDAAQIYLSNAGVITNTKDSLYSMAVFLIVSDWHENRLPMGQVDDSRLEGIITQLKYCGGTTA